MVLLVVFVVAVFVVAVVIVAVVIVDWVDNSWSFVGRGSGGGGAGRREPALLRSPDEDLHDEVEEGGEERQDPSTNIHHFHVFVLPFLSVVVVSFTNYNLKEILNHFITSPIARRQF